MAGAGRVNTQGWAGGLAAASWFCLSVDQKGKREPIGGSYRSVCRGGAERGCRRLSLCISSSMKVSREMGE